MSSLSDIEALTKIYSDAFRVLKGEINDLEGEIKLIRGRRVARIRKLVAASTMARAALSDAIEGAPSLFERPKTMVMHGIKIGFAKGKGKIEFANPKKVVDLIRKHFPDRFDTLVETSQKPLKTALGALTAAELKKLGATVIDDGDQIVIKSADGDIEKMVDALLKAAKDEEEALNHPRQS